MKPNVKLIKDEKLIYRYIKNKNDQNEHSDTNNNYFSQRCSFEDIIFKAFLRGLFFGCVFSVILWKFFKNIPLKFLIIQCLLCTLFNILYDFKSFSSTKYLVICTSDSFEDNNAIFNSKNRIKHKIHNNCYVYCGNNNSYIIEGNLDELIFLRDKIISAIKLSYTSKENSDNILENNDYKIDKIKNNLKKPMINHDFLFNNTSREVKKIKKRSHNSKANQAEFRKDSNKIVKNKYINLLNRNSNLKSIKNPKCNLLNRSKNIEMDLKQKGVNNKN
ncbi:hypothetical protein BCR36DRAFT_321862, partial [Piromyces finnis]